MTFLVRWAEKVKILLHQQTYFCEFGFSHPPLRLVWDVLSCVESINWTVYFWNGLCWSSTFNNKFRILKKKTTKLCGIYWNYVTAVITNYFHRLSLRVHPRLFRTANYILILSLPGLTIHCRVLRNMCGPITSAIQFNSSLFFFSLQKINASYDCQSLYSEATSIVSLYCYNTRKYSTYKTLRICKSFFTSLFLINYMP